MKVKFLSSLALAWLLIASYAPSAKAWEYPAYVYLAEDPGKQNPLTLGIDNFVSALWWVNLPTTWWADAAIASDVSVAINNWKSAIPKLKFADQPTLDENSAILRIYYRPHQDFPYAVSHFRVANTYFGVEQQAAYILEAEIYINNIYQWSSSVRIGAVAHELGGLYGLYKRFIADVNGCNPDELTIMDLFRDIEAQVAPCDVVEGPTDLDKQRVKAFWSGGIPLRNDLLILGQGNGTVATYRWQDMAWAELYQLVAFYYLDGNIWVNFAEVNYPYLVGTHLYTAPRTMGWFLDRTQFPSVPANALHRACAWAWFAASASWGIGRCSNSVWLD